MTDGTPTTPAELAIARTLMAETRRDFGMLVGAGAEGLMSSLATAALGGAPTIDNDAVTLDVVEQDGCICRSGVKPLGLPSLLHVGRIAILPNSSECQNSWPR